MAMNKIDRIDKEIQKTREKITEYQNKLKTLEVQRTEAENLQIVQLVRSMNMTLFSLLLYAEQKPIGLSVSMRPAFFPAFIARP